MRRRPTSSRGQLRSKRNHDGLRHPLIERHNIIPTPPRLALQPPGVVKNPHHRCIAPRQDAQHPPRASPIALPKAWRRQLHQHIVALHRAAHFPRRNEDVFLDRGSRARLLWRGPNKSVAIAVQIELARHQILAANPRPASLRFARLIPPRTALARTSLTRISFGNRPVIAIDLHQLPRAGEPSQLLAQFAALLAAAQPQFADQLLVPGAPVRQSRKMAQQVAVQHG